MRRVLAGAVVAGAVAAGVATGQVWLARWVRVLVPDQVYEAYNDTWPFQLVLVAWFSASAVVVGTAAAGPVVRGTRWRYLSVVTAAACALAPLPFVTTWASGAVSVGGDPVAAVTVAALLGAMLGAVAGTTVLTWPGVGRGAVVWVSWVWLNVAAEVASFEPSRPGRDYVVPADPLGMFTPSGSGNNHLDLLTVLAAMLPAALVGWWGRRRGDPVPLLGVVVGPLLVLAAHLVVPPLPGGRIGGDHYTLEADASAWLLTGVLGLGAGLLGALAARARRTGDADPAAGAAARGAAVGVLLTVAASLLAGAALFDMWSARGGWLAAGAAGLAAGAALAHRRGRTMSRGAGVGATAAGIAGLAVVGGVFEIPAGLLRLGPGSAASALVIMGLVGALARGVAGAAWSVVVVGGLFVLAPVTGDLGVGTYRVDDGYWMITAALGLLAATVGLVVLRLIHRDRELAAP